jgi:outer membrane protein assembly factor BamE (lipoprotein component of BamABCDE complex)
MNFGVKVFLSLCVIAFLSACAAQQEERGYMRTNAAFDRIIPGTSTNRDVLELLGSPSSYSNFGDETWYYISTRKETLAFFKPEVIDQSAVAITFDKNGLVMGVNTFTKENQKDIAISTDKTPTEGNSISMWQQLLGNLGRFNTEGGGLPGQHSGGNAPNR